MNPPEISVVIPTYNRARLLRRTLESVLCQDVPGVTFEIIVVDNNSVDETATVVRELQATYRGILRYIAEPRQGNAYARNTGVEQATAPVIAFVDDDVRVHENWLRLIHERLTADPGLTFVGGPVLPEWESEPPAWLTPVHWAPIAAVDYGPSALRIHHGDSRCLFTANFAIRREPFRRIGEFSPSLQRVASGIGSMEDHELISRLCRAGESGMYLPELIAHTTVGVERLSKRYHRRWHRGHGRFHAILRDPDFERSTRGHWLGVPAHVYRQSITATWRWFVSTLRRQTDQAFRFETEAWFGFGFLLERISGRGAEDGSETDLTGGSAEAADTIWGKEPHELSLMARTVSVTYLLAFIDMVIGLFMLPFNVSHLGQSAYGLWILAVSPTVYFSMLDLGYGSALVKFVSQYRAKRQLRALNEVISTMFFVFAFIGIVTYGIAILVALNLEWLFDIGPVPASLGRRVILVVSVYVALGFPFSVFGSVVNAFQRRYLNGAVAIATSITVALANVVVLLLGYGLLEVVISTTLVRCFSYIGYRLTAYHVFPALRIRVRNFRVTRLREVTRFSAFMMLIDLANKLNYATDTLVIGAFLNTTAVAVWTVAQRLTDMVQRLTDQLNSALFPVIVDSATLGNTDRLRSVLIQGTRISLAMVVPLSVGLSMLAGPLVRAWVGSDFQQSVALIPLLALVVSIRVGSATARGVLQGAGRHRVVAYSNLFMGLSNLVLSIALVHRMGLIGVAYGTLIPIGFVSLFILFPAACQRADIPIIQVIARAVWPTLWPAASMGAVLLLGRQFVGAGLTSLVMQVVVGAIVYIGLFLLVAIRGSERDWYLEKVKRMLNSGKRREPIRQA